MMFSMSFIFGNAASMAMAATSNLKGTGSAVMGAIQFCSAAITPPLLGFGNPLSVLPMALVITGCSVISILALLLTTTEGRSDE